MKNLRLIYLMVIIVAIVGCNEDADEFPIDLVGIWEMEGYNDDIEWNYVHTYIFNWDGTFQKSITLREEDGVEDLGYISNLTGSFRTDGNTLILSNLKFGTSHTEAVNWLFPWMNFWNVTVLLILLLISLCKIIIHSFTSTMAALRICANCQKLILRSCEVFFP